MLVTLARTPLPGIEWTFAVGAPGRLAEELAAAGARLRLLGDIRLSRPVGVLHARRSVGALLRRDGCDVAVCHAPWAHAIFGPVVRRTGVSLVFWQHDRATGRPLVERWARATPADFAICNSGYTWASLGAVQPNVESSVLACPVASPPRADPAARVRLRAALETAESETVVLIAARLQAWKGHIELLRALATMKALPGWTLWIAGGVQRPAERAYRAELETLVQREGLHSRVRWLGDRRDMPEVMSAADVYCQPNAHPEPFGIVFAEALLAGVPVITVNGGGAAEIVDDTCGRLVPPHDPAALASALRELVSDSSLRRRLGASGPAHAAARCSPGVVLPRLRDILASASGRSCASRF